ncbi:MAG: cellulase family glycosylhydrolase [Planctomycetota bacterium]|nr:cellulase family glycosylhydrolase [Planctomycetota bacterium]
MQRFKAGLPLSALAAFSCAAFSAETKPMERIAVAPDNWSLQTAESKQPWVPFGANYTPGWSGWAPDYLSDKQWNEAQVTADLDTLKSLGANCVKAVMSFGRALPDPQTPDAVTPNEAVLQRFARLVEIAGARDIRIIGTLEPGWHGLPQWWHKGGQMYGPESLRILDAFWKNVAQRFKGDGRILAWSFCVETHLAGWRERSVLDAWRAWAQEKYGAIEKANAAWGSAHQAWDEVPVAGFNGLNAEGWQKQPEGTDANENKTNDPFYYDFLLFREFIAFRYMHAQSRAVKSVDPGALTTMGFVQWNPILRTQWKPFWEGPMQGTEFSTREMAKTFDLLGIHFYPIYPGGDDEKQLRYLEVWARWAYAGKPVILEEFNQPPPARNSVWCPKVIERTKGLVCGWLVWTFRDTKPSDNVTEVCGLLDKDGKETPWAARFRELAATLTAAKPVYRSPTRSVKVDKRWLYTSGDYRKFLDGLLAAPDRDVSFEIESNASIDKLLAEQKK